MDIVVVVVVMLGAVLLWRSIEQRLFQGDQDRKEQFRQRMQAWSWGAAGIALVLAILFVVWLRHAAAH